MRALLAALRGTRYERIVTLIAIRGLRKGEALALRWSDIDTERGTIRIAGTLTRLGGHLVVSVPKTAKSRRTLPTDDTVAALFKAQRASQAADKLRAGTAWTDTGYVFTTEHGLPMDPRNVLRAVTMAAERSGLAGVHVHTLRYSAATTMLENGSHLRAVSDLLGHSDTRVTAEIYARLSDDVAKSTTAGLSSAFVVN